MASKHIRLTLETPACLVEFTKACENTGFLRDYDGNRFNFAPKDTATVAVEVARRLERAGAARLVSPAMHLGDGNSEG